MVHLSPERIAVYCDTVRQLRSENFSIELNPSSENDLSELDLELVRLAGWMEQRFEEFYRLQEATSEMAKGQFLEEVLDCIFEGFERIIPYDRIGCSLLTDDYERVRAHWARSKQPQNQRLHNGYTAKLKGSSLEQILQTNQPRILNDLDQYLLAHPGSHSTRLILAEGIRSSLTCPLVVDGKPIGFLFFSSMQPNTYRDIHQRIFLFIARQVSGLIEKSRLYQRIYDLNRKLAGALKKLEEKSSRDPLTGVLNRGAIMEFFEQNLQRSARKKQDLSVLLIDVDHFKSINDRFGHVVGDQVLHKVAQEIAQNLRDYDRVGRYGGEEFLVILSETDLSSAGQIAERIRMRVDQLVFEHQQTAFAVQISIGVNRIPPQEVVDLVFYLNQVDQALYRAKNAGRNRVEMVPPQSDKE
ncbi:MAG: diguanylate cyclase [Acidobacteria bacterium]|nr:diguanylate cyclase [Acidobacteriota bacterium]